MRSSEEAGAAVDATWSVDGYGECVVATGLYVEKPGYKIPIYIYNQRIQFITAYIPIGPLGDCILSVPSTIFTQYKYTCGIICVCFCSTPS